MAVNEKCHAKAEGYFVMMVWNVNGGSNALHGSAAFGAIASAGNLRNFESAAKLLFQQGFNDRRLWHALSA
jgi:hypothetical protein